MRLAVTRQSRKKWEITEYMKILIIRHGDPDYEHDTLTEKGRREAEYLSELLCEIDSENTYYYTSPYGRARDTATIALSKTCRTAEVLPWLREFDVFINRPDVAHRKHIAWDWLPQDWTKDPKLYLKDHWAENERMAEGGVGEEYRKVAEQFDKLLAYHGYVCDGGCYRAERSNHDTIVLFCHFGSGSLLLSHLWGVSPMIVWQNFCAQTSSVTTLVTEERRKGIAAFRMLAYGETTHLYVHEEEPSFAARFCECYEDDTRHD